MILLVTDTSGKQGRVGLARANDPDQISIIEEVPLVGGTFSAQLVPQIAVLLKNHRFSKGDIGTFIVVSGPGSFTGLRVGLAAIKALAEILKKPIVPVSLLEVVAVTARKEVAVLAALDAGRGEVYVGEYEVVGFSARRIQEQLLPKGEFLAGAPTSMVATPDAALAAYARAAGRPVIELHLDAQAIARVGWERLQKGATVTSEQLEANYIRRSDAEIFAKPVSGS